MNNLRKKIEDPKFRVIVFMSCYVLGVICMHFFIGTDHGDDSASRELVQGYTLFKWVAFRYEKWSARFIQEGLGFIMIWHGGLWKVLDTIVLATIPVLYTYIVGLKERTLYAATVFFMIYPIMDMSEAGWICTTNTYLWPAFFALIIGALLKNLYVKQGQWKWYMYAILYLTVIIASDHELLAALMFVVLLYYIIVFYESYKKIPIPAVVSIVLNVLNIVLILGAPGNRNRLKTETSIRFPEFESFNLIDKMYIGITRVCKILIMQHNALFAVLCVVTMVAVFVYCKSTIQRIIGGIPVVIEFIYDTILRSHVIGDIYSINYKQKHTYVPLIISIVVLICLIASFVFIYDNMKDWKYCMLLILLLLAGLATSVAMGFSPTIYVSGYRTATFMYFAFIFINLHLCERIFDRFQWDAKTTKQCFEIALCIWLFAITATLTLFV